MTRSSHIEIHDDVCFSMFRKLGEKECGRKEQDKTSSNHHEGGHPSQFWSGGDEGDGQIEWKDVVSVGRREK